MLSILNSATETRVFGKVNSKERERKWKGSEKYWYVGEKLEVSGRRWCDHKDRECWRLFGPGANRNETEANCLRELKTVAFDKIPSPKLEASVSEWGCFLAGNQGTSYISLDSQSLSLGVFAFLNSYGFWEKANAVCTRLQQQLCSLRSWPWHCPHISALQEIKPTYWWCFKNHSLLNIEQKVLLGPDLQWRKLTLYTKPVYKSLCKNCKE